MHVVIVNEGQLRFALEKPGMPVFGHMPYPELYQKAAILMETVTKAHTLSDGNKRTAMAVAQFMIEANGGHLVLPLKSIRLSVDTAMDGDDSMTETVQQWFKVHTAMNVHQLCAMLMEQAEEEGILRKLWDRGQYAELDRLISGWMAFDSYPERKKAWDGLRAQWETRRQSIDGRSSADSVRSEPTAALKIPFGLVRGKFPAEQLESEWEHIWESFINETDLKHGQYARYMDTPAEKTDDLITDTNSMEELLRLERIVQERSEINEQTDDRKLLHKNAILLEQYGRYDDAIDMHERLRRLDENDTHPIFHIAAILQYRKHDPAAALDYWKICESHPPVTYGTRYHIAVALKDVGEYSRALDHCDRLLTERPDSEEVILVQGQCHQETGDSEHAIDCYGRILSTNPQNTGAYHELGRSYLSIGEYEKALEAKDEAIKLEPRNFVLHYGKGVVLCAMGRFADARVEYEKALEINPEHVESTINLGSSMSNMGDYQAAIPHFERALAKDPRHPVALQSMAITLILLRRFEDARVYVDILSKENVGGHDTVWLKSIILANTGEVLSSLDLLEDLSGSYPQFSDHLNAYRDFFSPIEDSERFKKIACGTGLRQPES